MKQLSLFSILLIFCLSLGLAGKVGAQDSAAPTIEISHPLPGEVAQGLLQISGTIDVEDLVGYRLEFTYQVMSDAAWFLIKQGSENIIDGVLGEWDTSSIPDGDYKLRLTIERQTSQTITIQFEGIRVRNYSQIETNTPVPTSEAPTITPTIAETIPPTPTEALVVSPTPLNPNPASITQDDIQKTLFRGSLFGVILFIFFLLYRAGKNRE